MSTKEETRQRIGQRVKILRKQAGLSQEELGARAGLGRSHIGRIEDGIYKSRLGCTVAAKFSRQFSDEVSWQKVDPQAAAAASGEEDITEGGAGQGGNQGGGTTGGELEG